MRLSTCFRVIASIINFIRSDTPCCFNLQNRATYALAIEGGLNHLVVIAGLVEDGGDEGVLARVVRILALVLRLFVVVAPAAF